jgi:hypothetical protein
VPESEAIDASSSLKQRGRHFPGSDVQTLKLQTFIMNRTFTEEINILVGYSFIGLFGLFINMIMQGFNQYSPIINICVVIIHMTFAAVVFLIIEFNGLDNP